MLSCVWYFVGTNNLRDNGQFDIVFDSFILLSVKVDIVSCRRELTEKGFQEAAFRAYFADSGVLRASSLLQRACLLQPSS